LTALALGAAAVWLLVLLLPWRPWSTRERIDPALPDTPDARLPRASITALIPARNEAATIRETLQAVLAQTGIERVVVVDDQSGDDTAAVAASMPRTHVVTGKVAPPGWTGKLWAQQQGLECVDTPLLLLLDADIRLAPGMVPALLRRLEHDDRDLVSVMASLPASSGPEKLMLPAFVWFFRLLYPFAWVNRNDRPFAAAAGGCVLVYREMLDRVGAFEAWKDTLIDDCELAGRVRGVGGSIWLGLSRGVKSLRRHPDLASIMETIRRTAYTQLRYSPVLLIVVAASMLLLFAVPPLALLGGILGEDFLLAGAGGAAWLLMAVSYAPQIRFSGLRLRWALALPASAMLFLFATLDSAARHHFGSGAGWKGRRYGQ